MIIHLECTTSNTFYLLQILWDIMSDCTSHNFDRIVSFIDILGTSETLKHGSDKQINQYVKGIEGLYSKIRDELPIEKLKMFSDNILLYTDGTSEENIESLIKSVASIQLYLLQEFGLFIRGGVVAGILNHIPTDADDFILGSAIVDAHYLESHIATHPRVIVSEEALLAYDSTNKIVPFVKSDWDIPFIDYLRYAEVDGFVDVQQLQAHRDALIEHVKNDNALSDCSPDRWDKIRNKDLWALSYHNDYCKSNDIDELTISFIEEYSKEVQKIIIKVKDN